ncbi:CoA transferase [Phenylobacterium kunshanense]|uniref:CoA transferase n=1 Tax=Phenylobacterium kunshanense TaxID=1445034 RepID=A0A328BIL4_9CAUL|nr:CoA transferase [Phenylobacterium kunshanense]RAK64868.1 CoA transferase [Phenylobacterium kunshanense]
MNPLAPLIVDLCAEAAALTARLGRRVEVAALGVLDREGELPLAAPGGLVSPNGACRLFRAADGWMALNLARVEDRDLVPAWLGCDLDDDPWALVTIHAGGRRSADLVAGATLLGLPAAAVGEVSAETPRAPTLRLGRGGRRAGALQVVDLSALWAGPMCGAILAAMGASVLKVESVRRPDPTALSTPAFAHRLNGTKQALALDFAAADGRARLAEVVAGADVLITGARPRALAALGLEPAPLFAANPGLVWVAITGYGWTGEAGDRVAFGDDAAAAGGLVRWTADGPRFLGDALADPVTGLAAALGAMRGLEQGGGVFVDAALARVAAGAATAIGLQAAA